MSHMQSSSSLYNFIYYCVLFNRVVLVQKNNKCEVGQLFLFLLQAGPNCRMAVGWMYMSSARASKLGWLWDETGWKLSPGDPGGQ